MEIKLAPLQGYTEYPFRQALHNIIGGVDTYYTPYVRIQNDGSIKKKQWRDVLPENNKKVPVVPQVLINESNHLLDLDKQFSDFGYKEINWNLGCPYPMVTNRKLGSGLLPHIDIIKKVLDESIEELKLPLSIKLRLGLEDAQNMLPLAELFNNYPIKEITLHPRVGKQIYKGSADVEAFNEFRKVSQHKMIYNGDINSLEKYKQVAEIIGEETPIMIGRGLISDPFLARKIKGEIIDSKEAQQQFNQFHSYLLEHYSNTLQGDSQVLMKLKSYWEYFGLNFAENKKNLKKIKKAKYINDFKLHSQEIISRWY